MPSVRSVMSNSSAVANVDITFPKDAGVVPGDVIVAYMVADAFRDIVDNNFQPWKRDVPSFQPGISATMALFRRRVTANDPATYTFKINGGVALWSVIAVAIKDPAEDSIFYNFGPSIKAGTPGFADPPAFTTTLPNCLSIVFFACDMEADIVSVFPAGYTTLANLGTTVPTMYGGWKALGAAGSEDIGIISSGGPGTSAYVRLALNEHLPLVNEFEVRMDRLAEFDVERS